MASRAKRKWRYRQQGIHRELKSQLISTGLMDAGIDIDLQANQQEKMSEVILDFVEPFAADADSPEELRNVVQVGLIAWNMALLPAEVRRDKLDNSIVESIPSDAVADFQKIIDAMIARKQKYFAENRRFILAHHWTMTGSGPHLSVVSTGD